MMNSEEEFERYHTIGRLVDLIHKMPGDRLKKLLGQLESDTPEKSTDESDRKRVRVDCFVSVD